MPVDFRRYAYFDPLFHEYAEFGSANIRIDSDLVHGHSTLAVQTLQKYEMVQQVGVTETVKRGNIMKNKISNTFQHFNIPARFNGAVSVVKSGKILFQEAFGYSDMPNKIANKIDTRFATASAGKVFVATGILQLIEENKLEFETSIGDILPFDLGAIDKKVTIKQLLTHTSGITDYFDESVLDDYAELWRDFPNYKIRKSLDLLPMFTDKPMLHQPGEHFQYNNAGFVLLGLVIEAITKQPFDKILRERIFPACGMNDTDYFELDKLPERCANSYIYDSKSGEYRMNIYSVPAKGAGDGGAFTTIGDIQKFWDNLLEGNLISRALLNEMLKVQTHDNDYFYGCGIWLEKTECGYFPYFEGLDPGISFISSYDLKNDICLTVVSNCGQNVWKLRQNILSTQCGHY
jgi:CubicO group peptidase (beta-lactamase class C family)